MKQYLHNEKVLHSKSYLNKITKVLTAKCTPSIKRHHSECCIYHIYLYYWNIISDSLTCTCTLLILPKLEILKVKDKSEKFNISL